MEINHACFVIEGRLSIFLAEFDILDPFQTQILRSIKIMMDQGDLNSSHPAISNVSYVDIGLLDTDIDYNEAEIGTSDEESDTSAVTLVGDLQSWITVGAGGSLLILITSIVLIRYRFYSSRGYLNNKHDNAQGLDSFESHSSDYVVESNLSRNEIRRIKDKNKEGDENEEDSWL